MFRRVVRVMALLLFVALAVCTVVALSTQGASVMQRAECVLAFVISLVGIGITIRDLRSPGKVGWLNNVRI